MNYEKRVEAINSLTPSIQEQCEFHGLLFPGDQEPVAVSVAKCWRGCGRGTILKMIKLGLVCEDPEFKILHDCSLSIRARNVLANAVLFQPIDESAPENHSTNLAMLARCPVVVPTSLPRVVTKELVRKWLKSTDIRKQRNCGLKTMEEIYKWCGLKCPWAKKGIKCPCCGTSLTWKNGKLKKKRMVTA